MAQQQAVAEPKKTPRVKPKPIQKYRRAVDYLAAVQVYLKDNVLLRRPLKLMDIKDRLLGHWGTSPGINLIHAHLNQLIMKTGASVLLVTGPGHGAAANLANMYLDGSLAEIHPQYTHDERGVTEFVRAFSWPNGFPSHLNPDLPGVIHEGGELGYALSTSFGAVLDNPDLLVACIVGDGEAETGPTATAWHGTKFLNPATDGAVLPFLHLNGYKISSPTIFGTMTNDELTLMFRGYGWDVNIVDDLENIDQQLESTLTDAWGKIGRIQSAFRGGKCIKRPTWPMIVLKTPKGMGGIKQIDGRAVEGSFRSHQVPGKDLKENPEHLEAVEQWLRSYRPEELFDEQGRPAEDILECCPGGDRRIGMNPHSFGWRVKVNLCLPDLHAHEVNIMQRGEPVVSAMSKLGEYLREVIDLNERQRNFRIFCPDELESNRLGEVLKSTPRQYTWPLPEHAEFVGPDGRVLEILSEHTCQGWLQGYLLTGRHGLFPCYEAFVTIVDSMMAQYAKFLKSSMEIPWRGPIASLNYLLTSEAWRQDHNGYSHQGPGFINALLTKKGHTYRIYLPPDSNTLISTMNYCLMKSNHINLVVAGKQPMPQWLSMDEAVEHNIAGASIWRWASTFDAEDPQVILCASGDNLTMEVMAAADILRREAPQWRVRVVNVVRLLVLGIPQKYPSGLSEDHFERIFPLNVPVIYNFHGYTAALKQLLWERPGSQRFDINGYREEGTTTTPFDMHVRNRTSRYHLVVQTARKVAKNNPSVAGQAEDIIRRYTRCLREHAEFIVREGCDPAEISHWRWPG